MLKNPKDNEQLGINAKENVRKNFLITRLLSDYLDMLDSVMNS
jgi:trehalose synthase